MQNIKNYRLITEEVMPELDMTGYIYEHEKSGARVIVLQNEDENKVFSIGFRTPPEDSTGVPHIIEHTVLCGSEQFPAKDPFIELAKGSLNTFLNAMTYPDKTIYPVASCNDKDFANLMHVYLDAVFYPNIYKKEEIFRQEGWHYELESLDAPLKYNGVVYNEMKGAFSSPEQVLFRLIQQALLPDTAYGTESGGDPDYIPDLTYGQFLDFHRKYYHASNSYIYLYGNADMKERLEWMDEQYLSHFERQTVDSAIAIQKPFEEMREIREYYSIGENESPDDKTYLSYNMVIGTSLDEKLYLAFQILEYVLLETPGAPLKQTLLNAGIGKDILSSYDNGIQQPIFSIIAKNACGTQTEEFVSVIRNVLQDIVKEGLDEKALQAAINYYEFKYREADFGRFPKGLMYGIQILESWLYDDKKPFIHLRADDTFEFLKNAIGTGYYEKLIQEWMLDNTHAALVVLEPKQGMTAEKEEALQEKLQQYKESLSEEELKKIVADTEKLQEYGLSPSPKEDIEKIPMLELSDISKEIIPFHNEEKQIGSCKILHHNIFTNGIGYINLSFDVTDYIGYASDISFLTCVLGYVDTENYSFLELSNEINIHTGGMNIDINVYSNIHNEEFYQPRMEIRTKVLYDKIGKVFSLLREVFSSSKLSDEKRLKEIIAEARSRMEMRFLSAGHTTAAARMMSYVSERGRYEELISGIAYYDYICNLDNNFEIEKDALIKRMQQLMQNIFSVENLIISYTANEKGYQAFETACAEFVTYMEKVEKTDLPKKEMVFNPVSNEGFKTASQVQFVARGGRYKEEQDAYTGVFRVLKTILSYDYLWNQVRVKGGAYGCMCQFARSGRGYLVSYRDPNLEETNQVFQQLPEYVQNFDVDDRDMVKYIIGTISGMDIPLNPSAKGGRSFTAWISEVTEDILRQEREEVLQADVEKIRSLAPFMRKMLDAEFICVIGNEKKMEENKELFHEIKDLIQ